LLELTYNWDTETYASGRNFSHLAFEVDDIYATCQQLIDSGVTYFLPVRHLQEHLNTPEYNARHYHQSDAILVNPVVDSKNVVKLPGLVL
jgi:catechol 2,3-dioxygenase-like lactoylglutathione lyase family enzyme